MKYAELSCASPRALGSRKFVKKGCLVANSVGFVCSPDRRAAGTSMQSSRECSDRIEKYNDIDVRLIDSFGEAAGRNFRRSFVRDSKPWSPAITSRTPTKYLNI